MPSYPLKTLDESTAFTTARFSDRSKFGAARIWLPDIAAFDPQAMNGWNLVVRLHGGNGNNQGDVDPDVNLFLLMMLNELGAVVVSINWQDNGFYVPGGQDPRALFFPDSLLEPAMIATWLVQRSNDPTLFGPGGAITRDPRRMALFGVSDGGWRAAMLAYLRRDEFHLASAVQSLLGRAFVQPNVVIASQGHFDVEHFWMTEPCDALGWTMSSTALKGATTLEIAGGTGRFSTGHQLIVFQPGQTNFPYLVVGASSSQLTIWPQLRAAATAGTEVRVWDNGLSKFSEGGYSWFGAPMFRAGTGVTWASWPSDLKRMAALWPRIALDNPRVREVASVLIYPPNEPFVTNDDDPVSGWKAFLGASAATPRYQSLHAEANGFALAGLLRGLGFTQGTNANNQFLLRAGGVRTNPDPVTRYASSTGPIEDSLKTFLQNHGW